MKLLILGATGFLGSKLYNLTSNNREFKVIGTSRSPHEDPGIIEADAIQEHSIESAVAEFEPDVIIWTLMSFEDEKRIIDRGLKPLLSTVKLRTKVIFVSTDAVFVGGDGGYKETDAIGKLPEEAPLAEYINGKVAGEKLIRKKHSNYIIIRTGPLYSDASDSIIEKRTLKMIESIRKSKSIDAASNVYRTFVNVDDLANAILELCMVNFRGTLHVGPTQKESYYTFYMKRFKQLGWSTETLVPSTINDSYLSLDTSLNIQKAHQLLRTKFRTLY
ncbi:sugar nucleotide-binding protein [Fictibacillus sp. JL2B1089]|uniref:sugar nucleotide-binding protein n=1 Tax=Fictibacillus sp. JL2B1089 TaxID=3399565 RepID=UPI003A8602D5